MDEIMLNLLQTTLKGVANAGISMADKLQSTGMAIFLALIVLITIWMFVQLMLENVSIDELGPRLVRHIINIGIVGLLLTSYNSGLIGVQKIFVEGSEYLVTQITGKTADSAFGSGVAQLNDVLKKLNTAKVSGGTADPNAGVWDQTKFYLKSGMSFFTSFGSSLIGIIVSLVLAFAMLTYITVYMLGTIMLYVGITMGPFMIPWKLLDSSSHMFDGWLRFTTIASLYKVVCAILLTMMSGVITALVSAVEGMNTIGDTAAGYDILYSCGVLIFAMFMSYVLWQVPNIASGLVSGSGRANAQWISGGSVMGRFFK